MRWHRYSGGVHVLLIVHLMNIFFPNLVFKLHKNDYSNFCYVELTIHLLLLSCSPMVQFYFRTLQLGDNCIQICHLGRYIVGYTVGNFVLRRRVSGAVKHDFRPYIWRYTSPNDKLEYGYPHSNVLFNIYTSKPGIYLKNISCMRDVNSLRWPIISDVAHDVGFPTVYRGIYCRKFLALSNQTSRYICKCIRMSFNMINNLSGNAPYCLLASPVILFTTIGQRGSKSRRILAATKRSSIVRCCLIL